MKASTRLQLLLILLVIVTAWSCGGAGGGSASGGIGGSGFQASSIGSVSAVGSITVNGVRFETTTTAVVDDDGQPLAESSLTVGLTVEVDGTINTDGVSGTADQVVVVTAVQGPVDQTPAPGASSLLVMGQTVAVDDQTIFDNTLPNGLADLFAGDVIEVHGTVDPNGTIRASRIEDKSGTATLFKVRGFAASVTATTFALNGLTVNYATATLADFGPSGPADGDFVSVKAATSALAAGTLTANRVEDEVRSLADAENAEIEGFITAANAPNFTLVSGAGTFQFRTDATTEFDGGGLGDLAVGLKVEVEGAFSSGVLVADEVEIKDGIRLETNVTVLSLNDLTVVPFNMSALVMKLNDQTEIDERRGGFPSDPTPLELLGSLRGSDTLRIRARVSSTPVVNATELVVTDLRVETGPPTVIELRGPLDGPPAGNGDLSILGVTVTPAQVAQFFDIDDVTEIGRTAFLSRVTTGTLVKAEGGPLALNNVMDADQLGIED